MLTAGLKHKNAVERIFMLPGPILAPKYPIKTKFREIQTKKRPCGLNRGVHATFDGACGYFFLFTVSFRDAPAANLTAFLAGILISLPV